MLNLNTRTGDMPKSTVTTFKIRSDSPFWTQRPARNCAELLEKYLTKAAEISHQQTRAEAKETLRNNLKSTDMSLFAKDPVEALTLIEGKEKKLKQELAQYGMREKINYMADADVVGISDVMAAGIASTATVMFGAVAVTDPNSASAVLMTAALGYTLAKGTKAVAAAATESKTPEQKAAAAAYAQAKHCQLALKMLKKEIKAPLKAAEKAKYKEQVAKLYESYGNPSGGFIHNALAGKKNSR